MKVLMISSDRSIFEANSEAQKRMIVYGNLFEELRIVVIADRRLGLEDVKLSEKVSAHPTNHENKFLYLWNVYKIVKKLSVVSGQFSVVSAQDPFELGLAGWILKLKYKLHLQIQIHTDVFSPYFRQESFLNKIRILLAKFLLPRADGIRVVSQRIKDSLASNVAGPLPNIVVLPIFVDAKKIQSAKIKIDLHKIYSDHDFIILMASRLTKEKNIDLAIDAMQEIVKRHPKTLLLIIGDGPEREGLRTTISKLHLSENIVIERWKKDLSPYYKTADMFLLTSNYEGYGRTVLEAMAAEIPAVMTDVGLAGELLIDDLDGIVIPVGGREELIKAVLKLKEDKDYRENVVAESRKLISSLPEKNEYISLFARMFEDSHFLIKPKLAYVLPVFDKDDHTHFAYLNGFLEELRKIFDVRLIIEKTQNSFLDTAPLRALRMLLLFLRARFSGYKDYYVHYSFLAAWEASLIARISGGRVFYWNCGEPWKYRRNIFRNVFEHSAYRLISFLITGTESLKKQYADHYQLPLNKIRTMPNWISLEKAKDQILKVKSDELRAKLNILPEQRVVLFVHRLSKRKGAHYLPEILNHLKDENVVLVIVGDGPEKKNIELNVAGQMSKVRMLGWIPQNKVLDYFAIADVFLMPSEEEGFPHVLLESMAARVPFVATNVGGVKDMIPDSQLEYIAESGDLVALSEKIKSLLHLRAGSLRSLEQDLAEWVKQYDIKKVAEKFSEIILTR